MNAWSPLTPQDVLNQFNDSETAAYDAAKGDPGLVSLGDIINKVMDQIAHAYADAGRLYDPASGAIPPAGTIPAGEKNRVVSTLAPARMTSAYFIPPRSKTSTVMRHSSDQGL